jgi:hypothetical protein
MSSALTIVGIPMQADLRLNELPQALANESSELVVFEWSPIPGRIMGAAFDWVAVLGTTADLIAVAGALWAVYEKIIKNRKKPGAPKAPEFLIQVKTQHETFVQLIIKTDTTKEIFVDEFTQTVSALRSSANGESEQSIIETYEKSESHRRVHVRDNS